jgi:YD repeat-containing protein
MWRNPSVEPQRDPRFEDGRPLTPDNGRSEVWNRLARLAGRHLYFLALAIGVSFAFIYVEMTTRLFFRLDAPRQVGDPCLSLIRATSGPDTRTVWPTFGHCPEISRDPDRETILVDLHYGLLLHYKTERLLTDVLPLPFARVLRSREQTARAFGVGGTHTYDIGLVGEGLSWVDLILAGGGRIHYRPTSKTGWFDSSVGGYFNNTTLQWTGRDWRLRRDDGLELLFPESRNATRLEQAALLGMQTTDANALLVVDRDRVGNVQFVDAGGRRLDFEHDDLNRITAIAERDTGQRLTYEYNAAGCLIRQVGSGQVFHYDYEPSSGSCRVL